MRNAFMAILTVVLLTGCSGHKVTASNNGTTVTSSGDNQTVTVQTKEGTVVAGKGAVDVAKLGLPIYPGAVQNENAGFSGQGAAGTSAMTTLTTKDSFDKVYEWYKAQLPAGSEKVKTTSDSGSMAMFQVGKEGDKEQKAIEIMGAKDQTTILLTVGTKTN